MSEAGTEKKISLKILVDPKSKKVVFAEAGKEFVDFIFRLMSLPLSTVTKLLNSKTDGMVGSLGALYQSIESLDAQYYSPNLSKDSVLLPRFTDVVPLLSLNSSPHTSLTFYSCDKHTYAMSDHPGIYHCRYCFSSSTFTKKNYTYIPLEGSGYVKESVPYIVMDNLEVKPMSISLIRSLVEDFDHLEEKKVQFGVEEGIALLKASLEKQNVLTTIYLGKNGKRK